MIIKSLQIENINSYRDKKVFFFNEDFNILIGPNGGGKSNLLSCINYFYFVHLTEYYQLSPASKSVNVSIDPNQRSSAQNQTASRMGKNIEEQDSELKFTFLTTPSDAKNLRLLKKYKDDLQKEFLNLKFDFLSSISEENIAAIDQGMEISYTIKNFHNFSISDKDDVKIAFTEYLKMNSLLLGSQIEDIKSNFSFPFCFLGINREPTISYSIGFTDLRMNRLQSLYSRSPLSQFVARIHSIRQDSDNIGRNDTTIKADDLFEQSPEIKEYRKYLKLLGYDWNLELTHYPNYEPRYYKDGIAFDPNRLSSGEAAIFTILHSILGANMQGGIFIIDEPELHLHPRLQKVLLSLLSLLANERDLQIIFSTHSATLITPETINNVTRIFKRSGTSDTIRINETELPEKSKLLMLVNSHNNERIFFADFVVLVEGISDRIIFEKCIQKKLLEKDNLITCEVLEVHGKQNFQRYEKLLSSFKIRTFKIADFDYIREIDPDGSSVYFEASRKKFLDKLRDKKLDIINKIISKLKSGNTTCPLRMLEELQMRSVIPKSLTKDQKDARDIYLDQFKLKDCFILKEGELEAYLPEGITHSDAIIDFLEKSDWILSMPESFTEIEEICKEIIGKAAQ